MDCLLCVKLFIKEKEFENYNPNLELCKKAISELFGISRNPDVQGLSEDLLVCLACHQRLEKLEELQRKLDEERIAIQSDMVNSNELSQVRAKDFENRMSKSSQQRLILLNAIETANSPPKTDPVQLNQAEKNEPIGQNAMDEEIEVQIQPPERKTQIGAEIESSQGPSRPSTSTGFILSRKLRASSPDICPSIPMTRAERRAAFKVKVQRQGQEVEERAKNMQADLIELHEFRCTLINKDPATIPILDYSLEFYLNPVTMRWLPFNPNDPATPQGCIQLVQALKGE